MKKLIKELEADLSNRKQAISKSKTEVFREDEENEEAGLPSTSEIKVAQIRFAYKNGSIINLLKKRGKLIGSDADFEKIEECDLMINENMEKNKEGLQTPICAFVTFTTQEAKERALKYLSKKNENGTDNGDFTDGFKSSDIELEVVDAPEPSNILWENLQVSKTMEKINQGAVYFAITIILVIVFVIMAFLKRATAENMQKYPSRTPCAGISSLYEGAEENYAKAATLDMQPTFDKVGGGYYQCYCKHFSYSYVMKNIAYDDKHICYQYYKDKAIQTTLNTTVTILVSVINIVLRLIVEALVNKIGYDTDSERVSTIMTVTFVSMFMNTGVITLLTQANFRYMDAPFHLIPFYLEFPDFNRDWYIILGSTMVKTMFIAALAPLIELISGVLTRTIKRTLDSGFSCCPRMHENEDPDLPPIARKTKKTTIFQYVELYAGPVYLPHSKYAQIMLIIWVTFMYGAFIPSMFIVAFVALFIFNLLETYMLAYVYRKPPMFDAALDFKANVLLRYAPIMTFAFGYWALSNSQMFLNIPPELEFINRPADPKHELMTLKKGLDQSHLAFVCFLFWGLRMTIDTIKNLRKKCCLTEAEKEEQEVAEANEEVFDEELPNFWAAIPGHLQMQWYAQELYDRRYLGIKALNKEQIKSIASV